MNTLKNLTYYILISTSLLGCSKYDDVSSEKTCWTCTQKKVWDASKNGLQTVVTFKFEYCNKSEKDIQKIIDKFTYSGYEGGGNMKSTMYCNNLLED